jgi:hypothetical protein
MEPGDPASLDESDWIRHRIRQLLILRDLTTDASALTAIGSLIAEAEVRLEQIAAPRSSLRTTTSC